jgi:putative peptidoglycan lipid II flippase
MMKEIAKKTKHWVKQLLKKLNSQLLINMLIVSGVSLVVKFVSFYKEILIADTYGISELLDTFLIAVLIPSFIQNVFINAYGSVFIPNYLIEKKENKHTGAFQSSSFVITILIGLLMILLTYLFIDVYLELVFPGHDQNYYLLIKTQVWIILPCMVFWAISSLISGLLMADNEFFLSSTNAIFIPISIIGCLFFQEFLQEKTLALGISVGSLLSVIYLVWIGIKKGLLNFSAPDFKNANMLMLLKQIPAKVSSGLINGVNPMVDQYFSAQMAIGAIAALNYGFKIPMVAISLISIPIGSTILPYFSNKAVQDLKGTYNNLIKILKLTLLSTSIITLILILLSRIIIELFFERGAFTSSDTTLVYLIQQMYLIQLPFYVVGIIMNKYLTAINKNNFLVISSIISLLLNIIFNYTLIDLIGIKGLALSTSLVSLMNAGAIFWYIQRLNSKNNHV